MDQFNGKVSLLIFILGLGGFPLGSEQLTLPSTVPEDPVVSSSASTPTQQNLQPDVTSACKFSLSYMNLPNQDRNATENSITFRVTNRRVT